MDFDGGSAKGSGGGGDRDQGAEGGEGFKRKWSDLEASMKAVKDAVVKENAEKSAKIRRFMEDSILLEETEQGLEHGPVQGPLRPFPGQNPFAVFPPEVWEGIIDKMNRLSDLEMLCLAFPQLEPLVMKRKKTIVLFKNVIPLVSKHLRLKDINSCGLVCGSWNEDLRTLLAASKSPNLLPEDDVLSNKQIATTSPVPVNQFHWPITFEVQLAYRFKDHGKIQRFMKKMGDHPGNPFLGRFLCLSVDNQTELTHFWLSVLELVQKFGKHVWNLKIEDRCFGGIQNHSEINFYKAVQETLIHLPNLKYLTVGSNFTGRRPSSSEVAVQIVNSPVPPLPYLQSLKLAFCGETGIMSSAFSSLFSSQLRRLELRKESFGDLKVECLRGLINLEELEVELQSKEEVVRLLKFPNPNLKKLCLNSIWHSSHPLSFTSEQLASLLNKFSRLEHLDILRCQVEPNSQFYRMMQFSELKTLNIAVGFGDGDFRYNLDFLLWFSSLKHLLIRVLFTVRTTLSFDEYDKHSILKIWNYLFKGQVFDSNIWTLIPSLELLEIWGKFHTPEGIFPRGNGIYTREMFENREG